MNKAKGKAQPVYSCDEYSEDLQAFVGIPFHSDADTTTFPRKFCNQPRQISEGEEGQREWTAISTDYSHGVVSTSGSLQSKKQVQLTNNNNNDNNFNNNNNN